MILPRKTVLELGKLLTDSEEPVTLDILANQVRFRFANVELVSQGGRRQVPGLQPRHSGGPYEAGRARPRSSCWRRCSARRSSRTRSSAACASCSRADQLKIICTNSEQEEAEEELEVAYKGDPLDIGFNITYLLDALSNLSVERVRFAFGDANSSALVTMPERDDYKYVVMPMRI